MRGEVSSASSEKAEEHQVHTMRSVSELMSPVNAWTSFWPRSNGVVLSFRRKGDHQLLSDRVMGKFS
jgi:hypothetical protein